MRNVCPFYMTLFVLMLQNQICVHTFLGGKFYSSQPTSKPFCWAWRPKIRVSRGPPIHSGRNFLSNQITVKNFIQNELLFCLFTFALSFYRSKIILDRPNCFGHLQIILVRSKLFSLGPNHFGQVQIRLFWTSFYNLDLSKMI